MAVRDIDRGWNKIKRDLKKLDKSFTKVGLPQEGEVVPNPESDIEDMSELVQVGAVNEFGGKDKKRHPERSFLRSATDENRFKIEKFKEQTYFNIVSLRLPVKKGLSLLGEFLTGKVQKKIRDLKTPPNAPSTIRRKKSENPLIDTGQMVQSIQHVEVIK